MDLEDTIDAVMHGELEYDAIRDYCDAMPETEESLRELEGAIESYDVKELYDCLFTGFESMLSEEKFADFLTRYRQLFDEEIADLLTTCRQMSDEELADFLTTYTQMSEEEIADYLSGARQLTKEELADCIMDYPPLFDGDLYDLPEDGWEDPEDAPD